MLDLSWVVLSVLQILTVALAIGTVAIWAVVLKETISLFLESFGLKKTTAVATMALILLPIATAHAGDTIARIEDGNLVYYKKTGVVIPDVPKGLTDEQAQQLVDGVIPPVKLSASKISYFTETKTDTTVLFRNGWMMEEESNESFSAVLPLIFFCIWILPCFIMAYSGNSVIFFIAVVSSFIFTVAVGGFRYDDVSMVLVEVLILSIIGYVPGLYLRRRKHKRQNAGHVSATAKGHYNHA